ncbi:MAG: CBS domain-containing protein [Desulfobulbaceae bacterium]|nr:CBS domain-containing protein [Desulfobulbaceae bacterium]
MLSAKDIMNPNVITVHKDQSVRELAELFLHHHISGAPVVDEQGRLSGIVTQSDLIFTNKKLHLPRSIAILDAFFFLDNPEKMKQEMKKISGARVDDICSKDPITVRPDSTLEEVATIMAEQHVHTLPVVEDGEEGRLVGVIGKTDIIRSMVRNS